MPLLATPLTVTQYTLRHLTVDFVHQQITLHVDLGNTPETVIQKIQHVCSFTDLGFTPALNSTLQALMVTRLKAAGAIS